MAKNSKRLLIAGDSFAAVWPNVNDGWVNLLANNFTVQNLAQAGVGEYKILKQIKSVNLRNFDAIIVSHTSPSRIHTPNHPLHKNGFHQHCDLIITDIEKRFSYFNPSLDSAKNWFKYHYDDTYQIDIYNLIRKEINESITTPYLSLSHIPIVNEMSIEKNHLDFSELWSQNRGNQNHYTKSANMIIFEKIKNWIEKL